LIGSSKLSESAVAMESCKSGSVGATHSALVLGGLRGGHEALNSVGDLDRRAGGSLPLIAALPLETTFLNSCIGRYFVGKSVTC